MTNGTLRFNVIIVTLIYVAFLSLGVVLRVKYPAPNDMPYTTFTDLIPFLVFIPGAWLAYCFNARNTFVIHLRKLWSSVVEVVQDSVQYTHLEEPTKAEYGTLMRQLSIVIDEFRGVFKNLENTGSNGGYYPFQSLKDIRDEIDALGYGPTFKSNNPQVTRTQVIQLWKQFRDPFAQELGRGMPTYYDSPFVGSVRQVPNVPQPAAQNINAAVAN